MRGASTSGGTPTGLHGTNIVSVEGASPGGQTLSPAPTEHGHGDDRSRLRGHDRGLRRLAGGRDPGDADDQEDAGARSSRRRRSTLINPGQTKTVTFTNLGQVPFAQQTTVKVDVAPVAGEHNTSNNKASTRSSSRWASAERPDARLDGTTAAAIARRGRRASGSSGLGARLVGVGQGPPGPRRAAVAARRRARRISSISRSRSRAGSTICTGPSTRSRPDWRASTGGSTATVTNTSIVRYDAYEDTGGHQSASVALLDSARTGVVVTAIQGRDYARIYMKELERGRAVGRALARGAGGGRSRHGRAEARRGAAAASSGLSGTFRPGCSRFSFSMRVTSRSTCARCAARTCSSSRARQSWSRSSTDHFARPPTRIRGRT